MTPLQENTKLTIKEIESEFDKEFCNNHNHPIRFLRSVFLDEEDQIMTIKQFYSQKIKELLEEIKGEKIPEGQTEPCKDILAMNYLIGYNKGWNDYAEALNNKISEIIC